MYRIEDAEKRIKDCLASSDNQDAMSFHEALSQTKEYSSLNNKGSVIFIHLSFQTLSANIDDMKKAYFLCNNEIKALFVDNPNFVDMIGFNDDYCGIFDTPLCADVDRLLESIGKINAILIYLKKLIGSVLRIDLKATIGVDYTSVFLFNNIDGSNAVSNIRAWHGIAIAKARELAYSQISQENIDKHVIISGRIYNNIKDEYKKFFSVENNMYLADIVNTYLLDWVRNNKLV